MNENQNNLTEEISEQDINILKKVRLEKLDELKSKNANPYEITKFEVTGKNSALKSNMSMMKSRRSLLQVKTTKTC